MSCSGLLDSCWLDSLTTAIESRWDNNDDNDYDDEDDDDDADAVAY